jgi:hypothetical protein
LQDRKLDVHRTGLKRIFRIIFPRKIGALDVNMYQMYQSCSPPSIGLLEGTFVLRGHLVAQPLDHKWLHSAAQYERKTQEKHF